MLRGHIILIFAISLIAFAVNIPLGYLRIGVKKFSPLWFLYIHLSIPLIAYLRISNRVNLITIPFFITSAVAGQVVGGKMGRNREAEGNEN